MMQREDALLYLCCTQDLPPDRLEQILVIASAPTLDWEYIFALAHEHGVAPLIYHNLQKAHTCGATLPSTIIHRFKLATYQNALAKQKLGEHLSHALTFLRANQIDAMLFKGMALDSTVYDHPWYTVSKDVDLVLRPQFPGSWQHERQKLETKLHGLGIEFELNVHHDMTLNGALSVDFNQIWHDA